MGTTAPPQGSALPSSYFPPFTFSLQVRVSAVVMDALEILRLHDEMGNIRLTPQLLRDVSRHVFHEFGVLEALFRPELLVLPLEHGVDVATRTPLDEGDQVLYPEETLELDRHGDDAPLVVRPVVTYLL